MSKSTSKLNNKIIFLTSSDINRDGRTKELIDLISFHANVDLISVNSKFIHGLSNSKLRISILVVLLIIKFFKFVLSKKNKSNEQVIFVDNYVAALSYRFISLFLKFKKVIYDMRELYVDYDNYKFFTKFVLQHEKYVFSSCDVLIVPNKARGDYIRENFSIAGSIMLFENIRFLKPSYIEHTDLMSKFDFLKKYKNKIICTGGFSVSRNSHLLCESFASLGDSYALCIIGSGEDEFKKFNFSDNVFFLGRFDLDKLHAISSIFDAGYVHYSFEGLNNIYCSSGKVYEYVSCGLAVCATEHKSLVEFINFSGAGVACNNYIDCIVQVFSSISIYKKNSFNFYNELKEKNYIVDKSVEFFKIVQGVE